MSGLTPAGFSTLSTEEVRELIIAELRATISPSLSADADSVLGHVIGAIAEQLASLWDQAQAVYRSQYPDSATGEALDQVAAITGVVRLPATASTAIVTLSGTPGTLIPAGSVVSVEGTGARFATDEDATIGPDGTVDVACTCEEFGPVQALAGTLTQIETPVSGWDAAINAEDAKPGRARETDEELRLRREEQLRATAAGTLPAIQAGILDVAGVEACVVFENTTMVTDADGLPPKSFEAVVRGGEDQAIAEAIWRLKPAGILAHGSTVVQVEDAHGTAHDVGFGRPTERDVYLSIDLVPGEDYPGADAVREALVAHGQALEIGEDVIVSRLYAPIFSVGGVEDVQAIRIGFSASPTGTSNLAIGARELARIDSSRIDITEA